MPSHKYYATRQELTRRIHLTTYETTSEVGRCHKASTVYFCWIMSPIRNKLPSKRSYATTLTLTEPFFEWDMKISPTVVEWFHRAGACIENSEARSVHVRKLGVLRYHPPAGYSETVIRVSLYIAHDRQQSSDHFPIGSSFVSVVNRYLVMNHFSHFMLVFRE